MAAKKKTAKKKTAKKKTAKKKTAPKKAAKKSPARKARSARASAKKPAKKASQVRRTIAQKPSARPAAKRPSAPEKRTRAKTQTIDQAYSGSRRVPSLSADADSQGLSNTENADSESVGELLEEGNTFEAGVVRGVEQADDADEREVRTREFPEDDVPEEYLDKD
jgi:hypothetical protein